MATVAELKAGECMRESCRVTCTRPPACKKDGTKRRHANTSGSFSGVRSAAPGLRGVALLRGTRMGRGGVGGDVQTGCELEGAWRWRRGTVLGSSAPRLSGASFRGPAAVQALG